MDAKFPLSSRPLKSYLKDSSSWLHTWFSGLCFSDLYSTEWNITPALVCTADYLQPFLYCFLDVTFLPLEVVLSMWSKFFHPSSNSIFILFLSFSKEECVLSYYSLWRHQMTAWWHHDCSLTLCITFSFTGFDYNFFFGVLPRALDLGVLPEKIVDLLLGIQLAHRHLRVLVWKFLRGLTQHKPDLGARTV